MEREPLLSRSQCVGRRLTNTMNRHIMIQRGQRYVYCCCMPFVRGTTKRPSKLGRGRNRDERWASDYRYRWLRRLDRTGAGK